MTIQTSLVRLDGVTANHCASLQFSYPNFGPFRYTYLISRLFRLLLLEFQTVLKHVLASQLDLVGPFVHMEHAALRQIFLNQHLDAEPCLSSGRSDCLHLILGHTAGRPMQWRLLPVEKQYSTAKHMIRRRAPLRDRKTEYQIILHRQSLVNR